MENKDGGDKCVQSDDIGSCAVTSELENKDGVDKCHQSDDDDSFGVIVDSDSKLECSVEVLKDDDGINRELESDVLCPLKRRKTAEDCAGEETKTEGYKIIFYLIDYSLLHSIFVVLSFILLKQV